MIGQIVRAGVPSVNDLTPPTGDAAEGWNWRQILRPPVKSDERLHWREHLVRGLRPRLRSTLLTLLLLVAVPSLVYQLIADRFGFGGLKFDVDFLLIYCGIVLGYRLRIPFILPIGFTLTIGSFAVMLLIAIGTIYITDVVLIGQYLSFANYWPWRIILPWMGLSLFLVGILYGGLRRVYFGQAYVWPVLLLLPLLGYLGMQQNFRSVTGRNWVTSGAYNLLRIVKASSTYKVSVSKPFPGPTFAGDMAGKPLPSHLMSVGLESLGMFSDPNAQARIFEPFIHTVADFYDVTVTEHGFKGPTLSGEMRELCGIETEGVPDLSSEAKLRQECLPAQLRAKGFATIGIHGNVRQFYNRQRVYPMIGFGKTMFLDDFEETANAMDICQDVAFDGVCDKAATTAAMKFLAANPRSMAHVMTLRTHFPMAPSDLGDEDCRRWPELKGQASLCLYANQHAENLRRVGQIITEAEVKPDVLYIYGDHAPPFAMGDLRGFFVPGKVPVLILHLKKSGTAAH